MEQERHTYRVEVKVPRVAREGTTWRTVAPPARFEAANETGTHLRESLLAAGFDPEQVREWFENWVRCVEYKETTVRQRELPMHYPS